MDMEELGKAVREKRKSLGISQQVVADANGMSRATLSKLETGKLPELGVRKLIAVCATLGLDLVTREATTAGRPTLREMLDRRGDSDA